MLDELDIDRQVHLTCIYMLFTTLVFSLNAYFFMCQVYKALYSSDVLINPTNSVAPYGIEENVTDKAIFNGD